MNAEKVRLQNAMLRKNLLTSKNEKYKDLHHLSKYKIVKVTSQDPVRERLERSFGCIEEWLSSVDPKYLYQGPEEAFSLPARRPSAYQQNQRTQHSQLRSAGTNRPPDKIHAKSSSGQRSLNNDLQPSAQPMHRPALDPHRRVSLPVNSQIPARNPETKARPPQEVQRSSEQFQDPVRKAFGLTSQGEVNVNVNKLFDAISIPSPVEPLCPKVATPLKNLTAIQRIELSDNPLDFSVSEDEMNPDADAENDVASSGPAEPMESSKADALVADDKPTPLPHANGYDRRPSPAASRRLRAEMSLEEGEINEEDSATGRRKASSKSKDEEVLVSVNPDKCLSGISKKEEQSNKDRICLDERTNFVDDLEEGEIDDQDDKCSLSSESSSSSNSLSDSSSDFSEVSPLHSKEFVDTKESVIPIEKTYKPLASSAREVKESPAVPPAPSSFPCRPEQEQNTNPYSGLVEKCAQNVKASLHEPTSDKSTAIQRKDNQEPVKKSKSEVLNNYKVVMPPSKASTPISERKEVATNVLVQKPKHDKNSKALQEEAKVVKLKIKNLNGSYKSNDESKPKSDSKQSETITKPAEKVKEEKKDQKLEVKTAKKQPEHRVAEVVDNQQGVNFLTAIQSSNNSRKKTGPPSSKEVPVKEVPAKEIPAKEKKQMKTEVKSKKRKLDEREKVTDDRIEVPAKRPTLELKSKVEVPLVLRFNPALFAKLERAERKRKMEDEGQQVAKKIRVEMEGATKMKLTTKSDKKKPKVQTSPGRLPESDQVENVSKKPAASKKSKQSIETKPEDLGNSKENEKKPKMEDLPKRELEVPAGQEERPNKKVSKRSIKVSSKKDDPKTEPTGSKVKSREEIFRKVNEVLDKGTSRDSTTGKKVAGSDTPLGRKGCDVSATSNKKIDSDSTLPIASKQTPKNTPKDTPKHTPTSQVNLGASTSKLNSTKEKSKKDQHRNAAKPANNGSSNSDKDKDNVFRGSFKVKQVGDLPDDPDAKDAGKGKQKQIPSQRQNDNLSTDHHSYTRNSINDSIRRTAERHYSQSQLLNKMVEIMHVEEGGRSTFWSLLNTIEVLMCGFLSAMELSKVMEDSFNIDHQNQLIDNVDSATKELEDPEEKERLYFLIHSLRAMVNKFYYDLMTMRDENFVKTTCDKIRLAYSKNSPRSSPDSTCVNLSTAVHRDSTKHQLEENTVDVAGKTTNRADKVPSDIRQCMYLLTYLQTYVSSVQAFSTLMYKTSCRELCGPSQHPGKLLEALTDLQYWAQWFQEKLTLLKRQSDPSNPN